jgi:hypothetical protein
MGTNYYLYKKVCDKCGRGDEPLHVGKSSGGWCFSLHVIPEEGINDLEDWEKLWNDPEITIKDEYGQILLKEAMKDLISGRSTKSGKFESNPFGYDSWESFHRENHSEFGPKGLLRAKIENRHCIGHGKGTYDLILGEFS